MCNDKKVLLDFWNCTSTGADVSRADEGHESNFLSRLCRFCMAGVGGLGCGLFHINFGEHVGVSYPFWLIFWFLLLGRPSSWESVVLRRSKF